MSLFENKTDEKQPVVAEKKAEVAPENKEVVVHEGAPVSEVGVISAGTKIEGNITTPGHLIIAGEITGTTNANGKIVFKGVTNGDIVCESILFNGGVSTSNINVDKDVVIKAGTTIKGNITCKNLFLAGTVEGDIKAKESVVLKDTAVLNGSVTCLRFGVESGAKIMGKITMQ